MNLKLLAFILSPVFVFAQTKREIKISGVTTVFRNSFYLNIKELDNKIKVSYKIRDSLSPNLRYDKDYIALNEKPNSYIYEETTGTLSEKYLDSLVEIMNRHYFYTCDSLEFSKAKNKAYFKLINESIASSKKGLPLKRRSVIDGTLINFIVAEEGKHNRRMQIESPDKEYMPLIADLITETFDLFRKGKNDKYLTQRRTSGY